jgi:hypothetical protein
MALHTFNDQEPDDGPQTPYKPQSIPAHVDESQWASAAGSVFANNGLVRKMRIEDMETRLNQVRNEHEARARKVAAIKLHAENLVGTVHLVTANGDEFRILLSQLEAETAMRDRLAMAIAGIERAIEWREANPNVG